MAENEYADMTPAQRDSALAANRRAVAQNTGDSAVMRRTLANVVKALASDAGGAIGETVGAVSDAAANPEWIQSALAALEKNRDKRGRGAENSNRREYPYALARAQREYEAGL
jgi:hypothetical protein